MLSTIKKCALFTRSGGAVNNTGRCRSNRIYRQIFTDCVPSERSEFANVNGSRTYLSSVMLACVCIIFTDLALAESFSGSPLGNDYLGLLASIITWKAYCPNTRSETPRKGKWQWFGVLISNLRGRYFGIDCFLWYRQLMSKNNLMLCFVC